MKPMSREQAIAEARRLLQKPYARTFTPDEGGGFSAEIVEFPGCVAEGEGPADAFANLEAAAESWLLSCLERGQDVPEPLAENEASGRLLLRLQRSTHTRAMRAAAIEGVSLNTFISGAVAERLGEISASRKLEEAMGLLSKHFSRAFTSSETAATTGVRRERFDADESTAANEARSRMRKN